VSGSERGVECEVALAFMIMTVGAITPMLWALATAPQVRHRTPLGIGIGARGRSNARQFATARIVAWCHSPPAQPIRQMADSSRVPSGVAGQSMPQLGDTRARRCCRAPTRAHDACAHACARRKVKVSNHAVADRGATPRMHAVRPGVQIWLSQAMTWHRIEHAYGQD
jgi:hypothetical protein